MAWGKLGTSIRKWYKKLSIRTLGKFKEDSHWGSIGEVGFKTQIAP